MKKILFIILICIFAINVFAEIKWDQVLGGTLFAGVSYYFMQDGFSRIEDTIPLTMFQFVSQSQTSTTFRIYNAGNCNLQNFSMDYTVITWKLLNGVYYEDQYIPGKIYLGDLVQNSSKEVTVDGYTSAIPAKVEHKELWQYKKRYRNKNDLQGYMALVIFCISSWEIIDGLGILDEGKKIGLSMNFQIPQLGELKTGITCNF